MNRGIKRLGILALWVLLLCRILPGTAAAQTAPEVRDLSLRQASINSVRLTWESGEGWDYFELYRKAGDEDWKKVKNVLADNTYNYNLQENLRYSYKVRSCLRTEEGILYGEFSQPVTVSLGESVAAPGNLKVTQASVNSVSLSWDAAEGAEGYALYRSAGGSWSRVKYINGTSTGNYNLPEDSSWSYKVYAYRQVDGVRLFSVASNTASVELNRDAAAPENLTAVQDSASSVTLSWDTVEEAQSYTLYRSVDGGTWKRVKNVTGNQTGNYNLETGKTYAYRVCVSSRNGETVYGAFSEIAVTQLITLEKPQNLTAQYRGKTSVALNWDSVEHADGYLLYRRAGEGDWAKVKSVSENTTFNASLVSGTAYEYYVTAYKKLERMTIYSEPSDPAAYSFDNEETVSGKYRALLIGETGYVQTLHGPDNDVAAMGDILRNMNYEVYSQTDATKSDITALIDVAFMDATEDDVSLFYYSGHGVTGSGETYSGALQTVDYAYITTEELAEILSGIPGKVVVILDSCGSGAAISDGTQTLSLEEKTAAFSPAQFNAGVISVFAALEERVPYSGELRQPKFYVLTGSAYEENSRTTYINGVWGGLLTRGISAAAGRDYNSGTWSSAMAADSNASGALTLQELYRYCASFVNGQQNVQVYPEASDLVVMEK